MRAEKEIVGAVEGIKKARGGWRPGAGRPKNHLRDTNTPPLQAHAVFLCIDELQLWKGLLHSRNESTRLQTAIYLKNRELGMPVQAEVTATVGLKHLSDEELDAKLAELQKTLGLVHEESKPTPAPNAALPPAPVDAPPPPPHDFGPIPEPYGLHDTPPYTPPAPEPEELLSCGKRNHPPYVKADGFCKLCCADGMRDRSYLGGLMPA